jgi:hypothetical protein
MQRTFYLLMVSILGLACTCQRTPGHRIAKKPECVCTNAAIADSMEGIFDRELCISFPDSVRNIEFRQKMKVESFYVIHAGYRDTNQRAMVRRSIYLTGKPDSTSSKCLQHGYLIFADGKDSLHPPQFRYSRENGVCTAEILIWFPDRFYDAIIREISESKELYCTFIKFPNGRIYGDFGAQRVAGQKN